MIVVVPIRAFSGMERLAAVLDDSSRALLARSLAARVVAAAREIDADVAVITGDAAVAGWAAAHRLDVIGDDGNGLNAAVTAGIRTVADGPWAVVHADLPLVTGRDIAALLYGPVPALAPSKDGGTAAVASEGGFPFRYGPGSFQRHLAVVGGKARVVVRRGLAIDVDRPADLAAVGTSWLDGRY